MSTKNDVRASEKNVGDNKIKFNYRSTVQVKDVDAVKQARKVLLEASKLATFIKSNQDAIMSCKLNLAKKKIDRMIELAAPTKYKVRKDVALKITTMIIDYQGDNYEKIREYVRRKWSTVTISMSVKKLESIKKKLSTSVQYEIQQLHANPTLPGRINIFWNVYDEVFKMNIKEKSSNAKYYRQVPFKEATSIVRNQFKNEKINVKVTLSVKELNMAIKSRAGYLKLVNNPRISDVKIDSFDSLKNFFDKYYRLSGRYATFDYLLFDVEPVLLGETDENSDFSMSTLIKTAFKSHYYGQGAKKNLDMSISMDEISVTKTPYMQIYGLTKNSPDWLIETVNKLKDDNIVATDKGVGLGMFYKLYAEFISLRLSIGINLKFIEYAQDKDAPKNLRPTIKEYPIRRYNSLSEYHIHLKNLIAGDSMLDKIFIDEACKRRINSYAAMEGKYMYSYMTGEFIGYSSYMNGDVGMHGFSQYSSTCGELYITPLTNKFFNNGDSKVIQKLFNDTELTKSYYHEPSAQPIKLYGYFMKVMPDGHQKYKFNLADNFICPVTALTIQCPAIELPSDEAIMRMYLDLGIFKRSDIRLSSNELFDFYSHLAKQLIINFSVLVYYIKRNDKGVVKASPRKYYFVGKPSSGAPYYTYRKTDKPGKISKTVVNYERAQKERYVNDEVLTIALMEGHIFNTNVRGSLNFLKNVCAQYDDLPDNIVMHHKMMDDIQNFIKMEETQVLDNPCNLLRNLKEKDLCQVLPEIDQITKKAKKHPDLPRYKKDRQLLLFFYDYETRSAKNTTSTTEQVKFKARNYDQSDVITRVGEKFEDLSTVDPYSNSALWFNKECKILDALFSFTPYPQENCRIMMEWVLNIAMNNMPKRIKNKQGKIIPNSGDLYCNVFANFGAGFDNIITLYDMLRHIDMLKLNENIVRVFEPRKIDQAGRPISIDFSFQVKVGEHLQKIVISLRDSHRITSTPVASLGSTFGLKVNKLLYPYGYYQKKFEEHVDILGGSLPVKLHDEVDDDEFDQYCSEHPEWSFSDNMKQYTLLKSHQKFDCDFTVMKWCDAGIDCTKLDEISCLKDPKDVERYRMESGRNCYGKIRDTTDDMQLKDSQRIFQNAFLLQMAKICCGKFTEVSECEDQIDMLTKYQSKLSCQVMFNCIEFCKIYNYFDCYNVVQALCKFQNLFSELAKIKKDVQLTNGEVVNVDLSELSKIDIFQHRTISSIAFCVGLRAHVFDGMCKMVGNMARFYNIKTGGKVFVNHKRDIFYSFKHETFDKYMGQQVNDENLLEVIDALTSNYGSQIDLDINSYYSWSIANMKTPLGKPVYVYYRPGEDIHKKIKMMLDKGYPFKVCCSYKSKYIYDVPENCCKVDGKNQWRNGEFHNMLVDDVKMKYLIDIDEVALEEFKFTASDIPIGIAFKKWNYQAAGLLQFMYDERLVQKQLKNVGLATVYKNLMNNIFGKSILKENATKSRYIHKDDIQNYMNKNLHKISSDVVSAGNYYEIKEYTIPADYKIYPQFGDRVLTTSKTLMGKYAWMLSEVDKKNKFLDANPDFKIPTELKEIVKWTKQFCETKVVKENNQDVAYSIVEGYGCYFDTDSINCPIQCLRLMKSFVSSKLGDLESDYEFNLTTITDLYNTDDWVIKHMEKSAIECYYIAPKTYGCRVLMCEKKSDGKYYYCTRDHVRAKGVPRNCKPTFEDIKSLYFGNPVKYFTTVKGDNSLVSFIHSKGNGLAQKRTTTIKEIMPYELNKSKYYYADGDCLAGHYKFDELPIVTGLPGKVSMYLYNSVGELEKIKSLTSCYALHDMTNDQVYREGSGIKCGIFNYSDPIEIVKRPCEKEILSRFEFIEIDNRGKIERRHFSELKNK